MFVVFRVSSSAFANTGLKLELDPRLSSAGASLRNFHRTKCDLDRALVLCPGDPSIHFLVGRMLFMMPLLNTAIRGISLTKCEAALNKAKELNSKLKRGKTGGGLLNAGQMPIDCLALRCLEFRPLRQNAPVFTID